MREGSEGRLLLSEKGKQFYAVAYRRAGVSVDLAAMRTQKDLQAEVLRASAALCAEADAGMRVELDAGRIPVQRRESVRAYLDGGVQEIMVTAERWEVCVAAGKNVVPVGFGRSAAKIRGA